MESTADQMHPIIAILHEPLVGVVVNYLFLRAAFKEFSFKSFF